MEFDQYIGFLIFLCVFTAGFWLLLFLTSFIPYWIGGALMEKMKEKKEAKKRQQEIEENQPQVS